MITSQTKLRNGCLKVRLFEFFGTSILRKCYSSFKIKVSISILANKKPLLSSLTLSYHTFLSLPYPNLSFHTLLPEFTLPYLALPHFTLPCLNLPNLTLSYLSLPCFNMITLLMMSYLYLMHSSGKCFTI